MLTYQYSNLNSLTFIFKIAALNTAPGLAKSSFSIFSGTSMLESISSQLMSRRHLSSLLLLLINQYLL